MSYFTFNGYNSSDNLIITHPVVRPSWSLEFNEIATGSVSKLIQFSRTYSNSTIEISAVIRNTSQERLRAIYNALRGFGKLMVSSCPDEYLNAVASVLHPVGVSMSMAEINISFTLLPFAYAVKPTTAGFSTDYTQVTNNGTIFSAPEIRFTPTSVGDLIIDVNGDTFIVKVPESLINREITVDCDAEVTYYRENSSKISINHLTYNNYPLLHTGDNYVKYIGNAENATINVRERWF